MLGVSAGAGTGAAWAAPGTNPEAALRPSGQTSSNDTFAFDIPRLPVGQALRRYGEISDRSVLYETRQVADRYSTPVHGRFSLDAALNTLLKDTGLVARALSSDSVTVAPIASTHKGSAPSLSIAAAQARHSQQLYDGYLQGLVFQSLCAWPDLHADRRRIILRFSVNARRRVEGLRVRIAAQPELEPRVREVLTALAIDPPPPGVAQPVMLMISPEAAARRGGCPS